MEEEVIKILKSSKRWINKMNYLPLEKAAQKLNIPESELLVRKALKDIEYSKKKDKYNIDSILQTRTMTLGIDKYFNEIERTHAENVQ